MEPKEFAKLFGAFSTEKRVKILKALIDAGPTGLSLLALSRKTELSVIDIGISAEALLLLDLIDISVKSNNKVLFANFALMHDLFRQAHDELGAGRARLAEQD